MDLDQQFAAGFKRARLQAGLTQEQITQSMVDRGFGFYQATVYKVESGARRVTVGEAIALAQIFGTTIEALAGVAATSTESSGEGDQRTADALREQRAELQVKLDVVRHARREAEMLMERSHMRCQELREEEQGVEAALTDLNLRYGSDGERQATP